MVPVKDIMTKDVISVFTHTPIYVALDLLTRHQISGMPVINQDREVIGILSEKDVLKILFANDLNEKKTVDDYMSREVICFSEDDRAFDVCKFFLKTNIRRAPVLKDGKLIGIVSRRDLVGLILEAKSKMSDFRYV